MPLWASSYVNGIAGPGLAYGLSGGWDGNGDNQSKGDAKML